MSELGRPAAVLALVTILGSVTGCGASQQSTAPVGVPRCAVPLDTSGSSTAYAYITSVDAQDNDLPGAVYQYAVGSDGSLQPLSVASVPAGAGPTAVVSDPTGHYVYVANAQDATISQYVVGAGGTLMPLSPRVVSIGLSSASHLWLSIDLQDRSLYAAVQQALPVPGTQPGAIAEYSIGSDGTLMPLDPALVSIPFPSGPLAIDCSGQYAYLSVSAGVTQGAGEVAEFSIGADGVLAPLEPATVNAGGIATGITIAPDGQNAYVLSACADSNCDGQVALYAIGANGALASTGVMTPTGSHVNPVSMLINPSGSSAYVLTNLMGVDTVGPGAIYQYAVGSSGGLVAYQPSSVSIAPAAVAETTYGQNLYALTNAGVVLIASPPPTPGGQVNHYTIGPDGRLTLVSTLSIEASAPTAMTVVVAQ